MDRLIDIISLNKSVILTTLIIDEGLV